MQRRLNPWETGVNKSFENVFTPAAYSEIFSGRKHQFSSLFKRGFLTDLILSNLINKSNSRGVGGMLPREFFETLHTVLAILVFVEQILGKVCHTFGP